MSSVVLLTRRPEDNAPLAAELHARGMRTVELPCVRTEPALDREALEREIAALEPRDVLVLTSPAGVDAVAALGLPLACGAAVVGRATAARAMRAGFAVVFVAPHHTSAALGRALPLPDGRVVLARSDLAVPDLPLILRERGANVREVVAYRTVAEVSGDVAAARRAIASGATVCVASPSAVHALRDAFGADALRQSRFVAIGPRTAAAVEKALGIAAEVAAAPDPAALADAIAPKTPEVIA